MDNSSDADNNLERRRLQNRMAQRRFRQRRQNSKRETGLLTSDLAHVFMDSNNLLTSDLNFAESNVFGTDGYGDLSYGLQFDLPQLFTLAGDSTQDSQNLDAAMTIDRLRSTSAYNPGRENGTGHHNATTSNAISRGLGSTLDMTTPLSTQSTSAEARPPTPYKCSANGKGWLNALHMAAQRGQTSILQTLLQQDMDSDGRDSHGLTPLMHAVANGHVEAVGLLLEHGAQITALDASRRSALHWAVKTRREAILRLLLSHTDQANELFLLDTYDDAGHTPLHACIESGFKAGVDILLEYGANINARAKKA
ncbi:ankyrin repeat-containing domain protein [Xylaria venustula]|nr:ankyrin repeat-containing domain protein [Xylaria venustula]